MNHMQDIYACKKNSNDAIDTKKLENDKLYISEHGDSYLCK